MRQIILFVFFLGLYSCGLKEKEPLNDPSANKAAPAKIHNPLFREFLDSLPSHETPIHLRCGLPSGGLLEVDKFKKYNEFIPANHHVVYGLIGGKENFYCVVFGQPSDDIYPTLFTLNNNGQRIDSLSLTLSPCGAADQYQIPLSVASIDQDFNITLQDTIEYIHYPTPQSEYVVDSIKTSVVKFEINDQGQIIKI